MRDTTAHRKLIELLDANAGFDLTARGTTNHCPMALVALAEMGASSARLQDFFEMWERKYALPAPSIEITIARSDWMEYLGERTAFGALRICFQDWMSEAGPVPVISAVLRAIPFAPATGAFHALIRLAYGIEARHQGEIASGLASLISSYLPIDISLDGVRMAESAGAAFANAAQAVRGISLPYDSITARLRAVAADERFGRAILAPPANGALLDDVARATIEAYWRNQNFTLLHTVTATHAARTVLALLDDELTRQLLPAFWIALCAAYATVGTVTGTAVSAPDIDANWTDICQRAIASDDDHVIKMTYTCLCEARRTSSPLYRASAARLVS